MLTVLASVWVTAQVQFSATHRLFALAVVPSLAMTKFGFVAEGNAAPGVAITVFGLDTASRPITISPFTVSVGAGGVCTVVPRLYVP